MTDAQVQKHENEIKKLLIKVVKWIVKMIRKGTNVEVKTTINKLNDYYSIEYEVISLFNLCISISPQEYNHFDEKIDGGVKCWISLSGCNARDLNIEIELNENNESHAISTFMDYTRNIFEYKDSKLDKIIKDGVSRIHKESQARKEQKSLDNLNKLKEFITKNNV